MTLLDNQPHRPMEDSVLHAFKVAESLFFIHQSFSGRQEPLDVPL